MKLAGNRIEAFLKAPDPKAAAILVYGPDLGLVKERLDRLAKTVLPDLSDPFRVVDIPGASLKDDPARLADEAAALSLIGGRRVVRVREAGDATTSAIQSFLAHPMGDALVLLEGGDLSARSSLRKLFEGADNGVAIPCYADEGGTLESVVQESLRAHGLQPDPDALAYLVDNLGGDRRLTRSELDKLALYMGGPGRVTYEDAITCVGDSASMSLDDLALAAADGDQATVQRVLDRLLSEGTNAVAILRALSRHFLRLHLAAGHLAQGKSVDQALGQLRPPVHFKATPRMKGQVQRWALDRIATALDLLLAAEMDCKSTGLPADEICGRALMQIARAAGRRPGPGRR